MPRFRVAGPARLDLAHILSTSAERWGMESRHRYATLLAAAMRKVAAGPEGPATRDRSDIASGIRSLHIRHVHGKNADIKVRRPVHVLYYRAIRPDLVEIVRVLHESMEPGRHIGADP